MLRFLFFVFTLSASPTFAGYHDAFDQGIDQYAKKQGFENFNDYLAKRTACAILIIDSQNTKTEQKVDKAKLLNVSPPEGYHWMTEQGLYSLMKTPDSGYGQHPNSSEVAKIPLFPNFLSKSETLSQSSDNNENPTFLEVDPPMGYHWMSSGSSYLLMKNPPSGYAPHSGYGYDSSLTLKFAIFSKNKFKNTDDSSYASKKQDKVNEARALIFDKLENQNNSGIDKLFANIDKKKWSSNKCGFRMFVEINLLSDLLETSLTGSKAKNSSAKMKPPKKNYGYGY
jgi:hypothetical protein